MAHMSKLDDLRELRKVLHNYVEFALGERLRSTKEALYAFWPNRPEKKAKKTQSQSSMTTSTFDMRLDRPLAPSSRAGSPSKRAKRMLDDVSQREKLSPIENDLRTEDALPSLGLDEQLASLLAKNNETLQLLLERNEEIRKILQDMLNSLLRTLASLTRTKRLRRYDDSLDQVFSEPE
ncbi:hypothetical protein GQ44DRAFT_769817 [Phaeosphaeriaceae sp. PMI808]|nr:hypothetical protein GQ44DRAFT_769817 [Phaeosphaeriaceae sp. PMI808]